MEIKQVNGGTLFDWGRGRDIFVTNTNIKRIDDRKERFSDREMLVVHCSHDPIRFYYDEVTLPVTATPDQLKQLILQYDKGTMPSQTFFAAVGQTVFTCSFAMTSNVNVYVGGVLQDETLYTFTVGGYSVTFLTPFLGGETIRIETF